MAAVGITHRAAEYSYRTFRAERTPWL